MAISFASIPVGIETPGVYAEFDSSNAQQGPSIQEHVVLMAGQRLSTGTKAAGSIDVITSASQAREFYGAGSMLARMAEVFLAENKINQLNCIALDDDGAGVSAAGDIDIDVTTAEAGTFSVNIANRTYSVAVDAGDTATEICAALVAAVTADDDRQVDAAVNGGDDSICDLTYRHDGEVGNEIDIRQNPDIDLPAGVTISITAFNGGTTNPDNAPVITAMGETQYHEVIIPYTDTTTLDLYRVEMQDRWGPLRQNDGHVYSAKKDSLANQLTFLDGRNNEQETVFMADTTHPNGPHEMAANLGAVIAKEAQADPARPFQTVTLTQLSGAEESELFTRSERDQILGDGGTTFVQNAGVAAIERVKTTRKTNSFGAPDTSLADLNPKLTLSYLRYDFRTRFAVKFPRHKLAGDSVRPGPGQKVITPSLAKAEAIAIFRQWQDDLALVEGLDQFKNDLIVERNSQDPNRLDFLLPPDLINALRVTGVQIQFLL